MTQNAVALATALVLASCGDSKPSSTEPVQFTVRGRWGESPVIHYRIEAKTAPLGPAICTRAIERAIDIWNQTGVVRFLPASPSSDPDLTIGWRRGHHGACQPFGTSADVAHSGPVEKGTFIHFDLGRKWSENGGDGVSVFGTALHELGHVLGLGHSTAPSAVMSTNPDRPAKLSMHDLAGIHTLYGGGTDGIGDLRIRRNNVTVKSLHRVAPIETCGFAVFDCDGDRKDEVLIWRTDAAGHGTLTTYFFDSSPAGEPRLSRTLGPIHGAVAIGSRVDFVATAAGERLMVCEFDGAPAIVRQFDRHGIPGLSKVELTADLRARAATRVSGDLDGNGSIEQVERFSDSM